MKWRVFHFWDVWKVYCWELVCGGLRWLRLYLRFWEVRWRLRSRGFQDEVYFSIRNAYQRYASVAEKFGGHIQTLRVFLRRLSLGWYFGIRWAFWGRAKVVPTVWRPLDRARGQTWIARWKKSQKVIVKVSTSAFILYKSPANSAKPSGQLPLINFCNLDQNQYRNWAAAAPGGGRGACRCEALTECLVWVEPHWDLLSDEMSNSHGLLQYRTEKNKIP
jgi:uncharacterized protein YbdZ (MbtH family)